MLDTNFVTKLSEIVGKNNLLTKKADLVTYSYDATADASTVARCCSHAVKY